MADAMAPSEPAAHGADQVPPQLDQVPPPPAPAPPLPIPDGPSGGPSTGRHHLLESVLTLWTEVRVRQIQALHLSMGGLKNNGCETRLEDNIHGLDAPYDLVAKYFLTMGLNDQFFEEPDDCAFLRVAREGNDAAMYRAMLNAEPPLKEAITRALLSAFAYFALRMGVTALHVKYDECLDAVKEVFDVAMLINNAPLMNVEDTRYLDPKRILQYAVDKGIKSADDVLALVQYHARKRSVASAHLSNMVYYEGDHEAFAGSLAADDSASFGRCWAYSCVRDDFKHGQPSRTLEVRVAVRGTLITSLRDWRRNFQYDEVKVPYLDFPVHRGFHFEWVKCREGLIQWIRKAAREAADRGPPLQDSTQDAILKHVEITIMGHSKGAAVAAIGAVDLAREFKSVVKVRCLTFAFPGFTSSPTFKKYHGVVHFDHYINEDDPILMAPHWTRHKFEYYEVKRNGPEDAPTFASGHSILLYQKRLMRAALKKNQDGELETKTVDFEKARRRAGYLVRLGSSVLDVLGAPKRSVERRLWNEGTQGEEMFGHVPSRSWSRDDELAAPGCG